MLERHRLDRLLLPTADNAEKGGYGACVTGLRLQPLGLVAGVEILGTHADEGHSQPPVIGGKKAISSPSATRVSGVPKS
jgi:hypothetical protein